MSVQKSECRPVSPSRFRQSSDRRPRPRRSAAGPWAPCHPSQAARGGAAGEIEVLGREHKRLSNAELRAEDRGEQRAVADAGRRAPRAGSAEGCDVCKREGSAGKQGAGFRFTRHQTAARDDSRVRSLPAGGADSIHHDATGSRTMQECIPQMHACIPWPDGHTTNVAVFPRAELFHLDLGLGEG